MDSISGVDLEKQYTAYQYTKNTDNFDFFIKTDEEDMDNRPTSETMFNLSDIENVSKYNDDDENSEKDKNTMEIQNSEFLVFFTTKQDEQKNKEQDHKKEEQPTDAVKQMNPQIKTKNIRFNPTTYSIDKRKDYIIKKFKVKCGKYFISKLNKLSTKFHFYCPNSIKFTSVPSYDKNKIWLNYTIEKILTKYDKEYGGSNSKTIKKISQKDQRDPTIQEIKRILGLKYEEIIREYSNSEQFDNDIKSINTDDRKSFSELGRGQPANFISIMKNIKGNVKKKEKKEL